MGPSDWFYLTLLILIGSVTEVGYMLATSMVLVSCNLQINNIDIDNPSL